MNAPTQPADPSASAATPPSGAADAARGNAAQLAANERAARRPIKGRALWLCRTGLWLGATGLLGTIVFAWSWPGLSDRVWWPFETLNYLVFTVRTLAFQLGLLTLVMLALAGLLRQRRLALLVLLPMAVFLLGPEVRWMLRGAPAASTVVAASSTAATPRNAGRPDVIVYSHNTYLGAIDPACVAEHARTHDADVVIVQECSQYAALRLRKALADTHPHFAHEPQSAVYGHAVISRLPFDEPPRCVSFAAEPLERHMFRMHSDDGQQRVVLRVGDRRLVIQNVHLVSPSDPAAVAEQDRQVLGIIDTLARDGLLGARADAAMLIGDFNATPRSITHARLRSAGLREAHATIGQGRGATWPARSQRVPVQLGVRIDNAFLNQAATPRFTRVLPGCGSDHRGILIGLDLTPAPAAD
jgi:endonuclease/exonuclease/phosphatase (EEP) superfamily protein YafD